MSTEVQNKGISDPRTRTCVLLKLKKNGLMKDLDKGSGISLSVVWARISMGSLNFTDFYKIHKSLLINIS